MSRRLATAIIVIMTLAAVAIGAAILMLAPAALANTGCVYSGGGWICAGQQPPSEPGVIPTVQPTMPPVVVETPAPTVEPTSEPAVPAETPAPEPAEPAPPACIP